MGSFHFNNLHTDHILKFSSSFHAQENASRQQVLPMLSF